jgi:tetratricopeptide (TPR) repeat protein
MNTIQTTHNLAPLRSVFWLLLCLLAIGPTAWAQEPEAVEQTQDEQAPAERDPLAQRYEWVRQAYAATEAGEHAAAAALFAEAMKIRLTPEEAAKANPDEKTLYWATVFAYTKAEDLESARDLLEEMALLYPEDDKVQRELGYRYLTSDLPEDALRQFEILCNRDKAERDDCLQMAYLYRQLDRPDNAIRAFGGLLWRQPNDDKLRREMLFLLISENRTKEALEQTEILVANNPDDIELHLQLGYLYSAEGEKAKASEQFEWVLEHEPQRHSLRLEYGYLLADQQHPHQARKQFKKVAGQNDDPESKEKAEEALKVIDENNPLFFGDLYLHAFFTARVPNFIFTGRVREGINVPVVPLKIYASLRLTRDIRSQGVLTSSIYEDNVLIPALGAELSPLATVVPELGLSLFYEIGPAIYLYSRDPQVDLDMRAGILMSYEWMNTKPVKNPEDEWIWPATYWGEFYTDFIWFSRFHNNWIGLFSMKHGLNLFQKGMLLDQIYLLFDLKYDVDGVYYNNTAELGAGMRVKPWPDWFVSFYAEYRLGFYIPRKHFVFNPLEHYYKDYWSGVLTRNDDNPHRSPYHDGRIGVMFSYYW